MSKTIARIFHHSKKSDHEVTPQQSTSVETPQQTTTIKPRSKSQGYSRDLVDDTMTKRNSRFVQYMLKLRMKHCFTRDTLDSTKAGAENRDPCVICFRRYASIRCDPCTHGRVCKYCAYEMLKSAGYPEQQQIFCSYCYKPIDGFTRWRKIKETVVEVNQEENQEKENIVKRTRIVREEEHSVNLNDYAWELLNRGIHTHWDNYGYEESTSSNSTSSSC
ncbi:unnamed protein product [Caenorhabditis angaria]|uniref:RING-type domain-containing protein n=1 Tax=Caenorhabditis angaria TaxID=860376 RepID=A0A9P1ILX0_9PELO|nr:unnamed protein product [Caenorhabditis angaria]